ncbi:TatD family hydrolase [Enterobacteriaceae endosymbiont of Macroplea mutica]|uniref:TatD family hydrolase n=1 Tax=Enterobacteriaceae endosymbiont of Macroplea mutica TaxID=2675791 RepID=UPI0014573F7E|nr:TatD family hydrolase [Enterobacteriaceae endosymbiont of Macroplea mutica]
MFDISVNLTHIRFSRDRELVINRAIQNNINGMLILGSTIQDSKLAYHIATKYVFCWSSVGVHPHYANLWTKHSSQKISSLIEQNTIKIIILGECGLDYYRNYSTVKEQLYVFNAQLELAAQYNLPVLLHCRNAFNDFTAILKKWIGKIPVSVIHCFSGNTYELETCLDMNLAIGISETFFNKKYRSSSYNDIFLIPQNKLVTGSDSPYLLFKDKYPDIYTTYKGRNEPALLYNLIKKISLYRNEDIYMLQHVTEHNARVLLRI